VIPAGWRQEGHPATKTLLQFLFNLIFLSALPRFLSVDDVFNWFVIISYTCRHWFRGNFDTSLNPSTAVMTTCIIMMLVLRDGACRHNLLLYACTCRSGELTVVWQWTLPRPLTLLWSIAAHNTWE